MSADGGTLWQPPPGGPGSPLVFEITDGDAKHCPCGCRMVWYAEDTGWHCPHCDLPGPEQLDALLDHLPARKVRG